MLWNSFLDLQVDLRLLKKVPDDFPCPRTWGLTPHYQFPCMFQTKVISLLEVVLGLLQPLHTALFLTFGYLWGSWIWSQMIPTTQKHLLWHQNQVSSMFRTKVTKSLFEVVLGLKQPLYPVLDLQIDLKLLKMVPNDSPYPKTWG